MKLRRITVFLLIFAVLIATGLWRASKARCWQLVGEVTCRVETTEKIVALTFDDGPTPEGVDLLLPILAKHNVKATFFLIGNRMTKFPGQAEKLAAAGHELANHSYTHRHMIGQTQGHYRNEIAKTDALLRRARIAADASDAPAATVPAPTRAALFRPPFGKRLFGLPWAAADMRHRLVMWDVEDNVARHPAPADYANDIVKRARPGSIILIHPMYRHNKTERAALPLLLSGLKAKGFRIVTVSELLAVVAKDTAA